MVRKLKKILSLASEDKLYILWKSLLLTGGCLVSKSHITLMCDGQFSKLDKVSVLQGTQELETGHWTGFACAPNCTETCPRFLGGLCPAYAFRFIALQSWSQEEVPVKQVWVIVCFSPAITQGMVCSSKHCPGISI